MCRRDALSEDCNAHVSGQSSVVWRQILAEHAACCLKSIWIRCAIFDANEFLLRGRFAQTRLIQLLLLRVASCAAHQPHPLHEIGMMSAFLWCLLVVLLLLLCVWLDVVGKVRSYYRLCRYLKLIPEFPSHPTHWLLGNAHQVCRKWLSCYQR